MAPQTEVIARRAYRLALAAFVVAVAALLVGTVALLDSDWGGRLLRAAAGDAPDNHVILFPPGVPPKAVRHLGE